jgi:cell division protein FtsA
MEGVLEFAEEIFQMPVRLASPLAVQGLKEYVNDPSYATVVGLLHYGMQAKTALESEQSQRESVSDFWSRIKAWFKGEF